MDKLDQARRDLVIANRILAHQNVVDAYGHVSIRHPSRPEHFLLSRSRSPELVVEGDIMEFTLDGRVVGDDDRPPYLERFIHGSVYEARPDVHAVVHSHAEETLAFSISSVALRPVIHVARGIGPSVPVWDIADQFGDTTNLLVTNVDHGRDLARRLGQGRVVLMRGHGFAAAGSTAMDVVRTSVYLPVNARVLTTALRFGPFKTLGPGEIQAGSGFNPAAPESWRAWEYWAHRAGVGELLGRMA
ncbi:MAG TPA: class II aldolase/adducin family protein [Acetobacteraceae bacterium]|nr:class II aldolase/adducin family protein [Acetobacteraceae bacterium]